MILTEGHPGLTDTLNGDKLTQEVFDGQALDYKPSRLRRKSLFLEFALLGTRHGVGTVSDLPHLPISKTQNQISYMRGELVELGKSDTVPPFQFLTT